MEREQLEGMLRELRGLREQTLAELSALSEADFGTAVNHARWSDVRRVLLRFGDHLREHANQIEGTRAAIGHPPTMPQRMLAEAEMAWGKLQASLVGLTDEELTMTPPDGGWSIQQALEHVIWSESNYLNLIRAARQPGRADQ